MPTTIITSGNSVTQWRDKSGYSNNAITQSPTGPIWKPWNNDIQNTSITFDGNNYMQINKNFMSTFNGRNWWYKMFQRGQDEANKDTVISILRTYLDLNDPDVEKVIESLRSEMTREEFAQEVMCRPISKDTLFSDVENKS